MKNDAMENYQIECYASGKYRYFTDYAVHCAVHTVIVTSTAQRCVKVNATMTIFIIEKLQRSIYHIHMWYVLSIIM